MQFWWLIPIVLFVCALEGVAVYFLRYKCTLSLIIVMVIAAIVMGYTTFEFAGYRVNGIAEYPIEFSHISYFIFGSIVLLGFKKLYGLAGYCATLTGLGNVIAVCVSPDSMITGLRSGGYFALSIILHNLMLFGGVLLLCNSVKFRLKDMWTAFLAIALICGFAQLVNAGVIYGDIDYKDTSYSQDNGRQNFRIHSFARKTYRRRQGNRMYMYIPGSVRQCCFVLLGKQ